MDEYYYHNFENEEEGSLVLGENGRGCYRKFHKTNDIQYSTSEKYLKK